MKIEYNEGRLLMKIHHFDENLSLLGTFVIMMKIHHYDENSSLSWKFIIAIEYSSFFFIFYSIFNATDKLATEAYGLIAIPNKLPITTPRYVTPHSNHHKQVWLLLHKLDNKTGVGAKKVNHVILSYAAVGA